MRTRTMVPFAIALLIVPVQASAQASGDWSPWLGCWRAEAVGNQDAGPLVCVLPGDDATTVRIATIEGGSIAEETVVRADGVARPIEDGGCSGSERAFFSADGRRVFTSAELECTGLGRKSTGVLAMISGGEWLDAQALTVNGQHAARAIRYRAAADSDLPEWVAAELPQGQRLAQQTARLNAAAALDVAAVAELSRNVAAPAVEALLGARAQEFAINAETLLELDAQGVPASTIDMMVAVSHPDRFRVAQAESTPRYADVDDEDLARARAALASRCYDSHLRTRRYRSDCFLYGYDYGYGYGSGFGYSPWGYDPYGWNYRRPVYVIVPPASDRPPASGGSVIKGRGYRRSGTSVGTPSRRGAVTSSPSTSSSSRSTASPSSSSSSSSSGSSRSEPRKAKPRGGGGN